MKTGTFFFIISFLILNELQAQQQPVIIPGQYIVIVKESAAQPVVKRPNRSFNRIRNEDTVYRNQNFAKIKEIKTRQGIGAANIILEYADIVVGFSARLSSDEADRLKKDKDVKAVYPDYVITPADYKPGTVAPTPAPAGQTEDCAVVTAGHFSDGSAKYTWIWIMDTGIDLDHPDLNVQVDSPYAKSFTGEPVDDQNGHGTIVAGIAAAKNNDFGVVGVSAGAKVVPVKVLSNAGPGQDSWIMAGLNHIARYAIPGDVVNMSLGSYNILPCSFFPEENTAIINLGKLGIWVVMAAGNDAGDANLLHPGCLNGDRLFTVGAMDCAIQCASFSNFGSNVDYVTVGVNVFSTYMNGGYTVGSGTSLATPVLSGLLHQLNNYPPSHSVISCKGAVYKIPTKN